MVNRGVVPNLCVMCFVILSFASAALLVYLKDRC